MGIEYETGDSVQRSLDFWMPLSSYGVVSLEPQHAKRPNLPGGVTYLGDANDSVV